MRQIHGYTDSSSVAADHVELLVHGVGGTPPESMLGTDDIEKVRGDSTAGFFRKKRASETDPYVQEAYSWGGLTSRSASRAWWVLLAPFAFVNVAGWMLPNGRDHERRHSFATALLRLIGFLITVHSVIWIGQMTVDFASWQCGASVSCRSSTWVLSVFDSTWFRGAPGRRLVVGMVGPLVALGAFRWLSYRAVDRYETVTSDALDDYGPHAIASSEVDSFADPTFWRRGESIRSFASLHMAGAAAAVAWLVAWTFGWLQPTGTPWIQYGLGIASFLLFLVAGYGVSVGRNPSPTADDEHPAWLVALVRWHWVATTVVVGLILAAGIVWPGYEDPSRAGPMNPYGDLWAYVWYVTVVVLLVFVGVVLSHPAFRRSVPSPVASEAANEEVELGFWGIGSIVASLFGFLVAVVMLASFGAATARLFGGRPTIEYTYLYDLFAVTTVVWTVVLLGALLVAWLIRSKVPLDVIEEDIADGFSEDRRSFATGPKRKRKWLTTVRRMRDVRAFIPRAESILGVMVLAAFAIAVTVVILDGLAPATLDSLAQRMDSSWVTGFVWVIAVGVPFGLMNSVRRAYGSRQARKTIGTLWDVVTFWPRWFHPLAPPSYSGQAIPELRTRLDYLVGNVDESHRFASVVITAHSQGSVVALAALDGLKAQEWFSKLSLLTHGSPITRLYVRYFPAHVAPAVGRVHGAIGQDRWANLYRLTDPIGGAISGETSGAPLGCWHPGVGEPLSKLCPDASSSFISPVADPDLRLFSEAGPTGAPMYPQKGDPYPEPLGHSEYFKAREFDTTVRRLLGITY
jgi:hypothetical protein